MCSFLKAGHEFHLYSFNSIKNVPDGVVQREAREVFDDTVDLSPYFAKRAWTALANLFRYKMMLKRLGVWVDLDLICIEKIEFSDSEIFGWVDEKFINNAVLYIENKNLLHDLVDIFNVKKSLPQCVRKYSSSKRYAKLYVKNLFHGPLHIVDLPWGTTGPKGLTWLVGEHNLACKAKDVSVFYPLKMSQAQKIFDPEFDIEAVISDETKTIHLWNNKIKTFKNHAPHPDSYIGRLCREFDIN